MKTKRKKEIKIKTTDRIRYNSRTISLGRAMFEFCPVFRYGYMRKLFIYRCQQEGNEDYVLEFDKKWKLTNFEFQSNGLSGNRDIDNPRSWMQSWCKVHKTICFSVYVPDNSEEICFQPYFGDNLTIYFGPKDIREVFKTKNSKVYISPKP